MKNDPSLAFRKYKIGATNFRVMSLDNFKENKDDPTYLDRCEI